MAAVGAVGVPSLSMIEGWDTEHLRAAARSWSATATLWEESFDRVYQGALRPGGTVWEGEAADAAAERTFADLVKVRGASDRLAEAADIARRAADRLGDLKRSAISAIGDARAAGFTVGEDLSVSDNSVLPVGPALAARQAQAEEFSAEIHARAAALSFADHKVAANISAALAPLAEVAFAESPEGNGTVQAVDYKTSPANPQDPYYDTGSEIPVGKSPAEVKSWWDGLSQDKKDQLLRDWPERIGALDGVPVADRSTANTTVMQRDIDRVAEVAKSRGVTPDEVLAHPDRYGMAGPMMDRYQNGLKAKEALATTSNATGARSFLQVYQPEAFGGDGRAAVAIGDPDHAANTAVVVPGTGNSVRNGWLAQDDAIRLYTEMVAADPNASRSVVAWQGYDAPDSPVDPRIGTTALAREGGQLLAADVNALNATHNGVGHLTVQGHSYGSTTVADAAAGFGMHTDDVVLIGCPGTDLAHSAADFNLNAGGHLYVGAASTDPVTQLGALPQTPVFGTGWSVALGTDPAMDGYGSTRFKAEVPGLTFPLGDHSQYYAPRSESLYSMAEIATGNGEALAQHGMTAPHRLPVVLPGINGSVDPELVRLDIARPTH